ncbi:MAG: TM0106 family RecB-like putative nuclease [Nitrospinota bacterium]|jgi:uncharacterized protein|nr:TM0106 family RecB-like putative nuclease [Nitrospinota bacterium]
MKKSKELKTHKKKYLLNPTMFMKYLNCKYYIVNVDNGEKRKETTVSKEALFERGRKHEKDYFNNLKKKYKDFVEIKGDRDHEKKWQTDKAMKNGKELIYQGRLANGSWSGISDFLIKTSNKTKLGNYGYEVTDTKISSNPTPYHLIQISLYSDLLSKFQGRMPDEMHLILKGNKQFSVPTKEAMDYYSVNKRDFESFLNSDFKKTTKPEKCSYCPFCDYEDACKGIWKKEDNLNRIAGIHKSHIKKIKNYKISTVHEFAELDSKTKIPDLTDEKFAKIHNQARLQLHKEKTGENKFDLLKVVANRGFNRLPKKGTCDLFFDIEGVPDYVYKDKLQYLFGIKYVENGKEKFQKYLAHDHVQEKKMLISFMDFITAHFKKYPDSHVYHYHDYEIQALDELTAKYNIKNKALDDLLRLGKFVDLYKVVREGVQVSEDSYSLKNLEKFYNFNRLGNVLTAEESIDSYVKYTISKDKKILDEIVSYNEQDCLSTLKLRDWLLDRRPDNSKWFVADKEEVEKLEWEEKIIDYEKRINKAKLEEGLKTMLSNILGFHRRENRPVWRALIARRSKTIDELIDDPESIGGMTMIEKAYQLKKSYVYTYKFPPQEYKLQKGDQAINAWASFGDKDSGAVTIVSVDEKKCTLEVSRSIKKEKPPEVLNLGPRGPIKPDSLESSIYSFIDSVIKNSKKYKPLLEILAKSHPDIKGIKQGDKIISSSDFETEIPRAISSLNNSYIVLQGPPGTGKTYQAANAIVDLVKQGKKVGVSAHSHKVIHNLLDRIEKTADKKVTFKGLKKGGQKEEHIYSGKFITTPEKSRDPYFIAAIKDPKINLHAGTVYHFSKGYFDQALDYLFVDEAGQVSLANLIAMGRAAKNIILIGDQMQLSQPIKAVHPGEVGKSALNYLLQGRDTIPSDRGVFIDITRRLHPNLNGFVSPNFYDGRLKCHDFAQKREILFPGKDEIFKNPGLYYLPITHTDCSQQSDEEGEVVKKLYKKFQQAKFKDENGNTKTVSFEDILTVSPYNVQVNYLRSILPKDSKVGTIDKFQGQEAPIVIISMTTSDPENLTRNLEFFYSRNRLNVAISRAQCLSVVIMNPELFRLNCKKVSQVKLVNTLLKLEKFKINDFNL